VYDLFVSYHWRDREAVEMVARDLRDRGLKIFLDRWYLVPGQSWIAALEKVLGECAAAAIFLGPFGMGRWQQREMERALDRQTQAAGRSAAGLHAGHDRGAGASRSRPAPGR
jgi:TIR domain